MAPGMISKRVAIDKANAQIVGVLAAASFITIFCLFAAHSVWSLNSYQARVTKAKENAKNQLDKNITAYNQLTQSYKSFASTPNNVIGGLSNGSGGNSGDNAKIILDALPPSYDFPALTSSLENILSSQGLSNATITGTDDQLNQQSNNSSSNPQPVPMPFTLSVNSTNYTTAQQLINVLQESIRPIALDTLELSGGSNNMSINLTAHTFYQPSKSLTITSEVVK